MGTDASLPLVEELAPAPQAEEVFARMAGLPHCLFLDSALAHPTLGRYSFVAADPFDFVQFPADGSDALSGVGRAAGPLLRGRRAWAAALSGGRRRPAGLRSRPQSGTCAAARGRRVSRAGHGRRPLRRGRGVRPLGRPSVAHLAGVPGDRAFAPSAPCRPAARPDSRSIGSTEPQLDSSSAGRVAVALPPQGRQATVVPNDLSPQYAVPGTPGVTSNFSKDGYLRAVERVIDYIYAGDVFQVNLSQRLLAAARDDSVALYRRLRRCNPAPFAGYFDLGEFQILSASPERFLQVLDGEVETRPIKGTRPRTGDPAADRAAEAELLASEKDRAENVMIVDLMRNDLARVCRPESVRVGQLCGVEAYRTRVAPGVGRARPAARGSFADRSGAGGVSGRLGDRRAEGPGDGDHRRIGADRPRRLLRLAGLPRLRRLDGLEHSDPHDHRRPRLVAVPRRRRHRGRVHARAGIRRNVAQGGRTAAGIVAQRGTTPVQCRRLRAAELGPTCRRPLNGCCFVVPKQIAHRRCGCRIAARHGGGRRPTDALATRGLPSNSSIAAASAAASSGGTSRAAPLPGGKISGVPPTSVATTATPAAAASSSTRPSGSCRAGCTSSVNSPSSRPTSLRRPRK